MSAARSPPDTAELGLSDREAAARQARFGPNILPGGGHKPGYRIVLEVLAEPMFLLLLAAGAIYLLLGDRAEAVFLLASVFVVVGITLAQQHKTQRALESLRALSAPRALVVRGGRELRVPGSEVVPGDLVSLHEGDRIPADAVLRHGHIEVDESLLTGESVPVVKHGEAEALHASTVVTRGHGFAEVTATGAATRVGGIGQAMASTRTPLSQLQRAARRLVRRLSLLGLVLAFGYGLLTWLWDGHALLESVLAGIALSMAILPEEIPVVMTVFLALGAWRLARHNVLARHIPAVEVLGSISVLAVDKTGTLTQNRMRVSELVIDGMRFASAGATVLPECFHRLAEFAMLATPADPFDPMEKAIQRFGSIWLEGTEHMHTGLPLEREYALSPQILAMTRVYPHDAPHRYLLAAKGAPEAIVDLCHLTASAREDIQRQVSAMAARGLRVLGVASGTWQGPSWPSSQHDFAFRFLGLLGFEDPPRPEVATALATCRMAGIRVIMLTGDHPATAQSVARQVGLAERPDVITGEDIEKMSDAVLYERMRQVHVCARVQPEQKLRLVRILQQQRLVVGMTGDGVNDAPALKAADVGIAMGERGTDVAREAAALVLLDDSFASIVEAIRQGRRIDDNMTRAIRFVFAVHVPVIALALIPTLLHWPMLMMPVNIMLLELLIDPACSLVFEAEPTSAALMQGAPRAVGASPFRLRNLAQGILQGTGLAALLLLGYGTMLGSGLDTEQSRTAVFLALLAGVFALTLANRRRPLALRGNRWPAWMLLAVAALLLALTGVPFMRTVMGMARPTPIALGAMATMLALALAWLGLIRRRH